MTIQAEALKVKQQVLFKVQYEWEKLFFDFPLSIDMLKTLGLSLLIGYSSELIAKIMSLIGDNSLGFDITDQKQLKIYLKNQPTSKAIFKVVDDSMDEELLSDALLKCINSPNNKAVINEELVRQISPDEDSLKSYINTIKNDNQKDLKSKLKNIQDKFKNKLNELSGSLDEYSETANEYTETVNEYLVYMLLAYYIINFIIEIFNKTDIPSGYISKYIAKVTSVTIASVSNANKELYETLSPTFSILYLADAILTALIVAMAIYIRNRKKYQENSTVTLEENTCPVYLENNSLEPVDPSSNVSKIETLELPTCCKFNDLDVEIVPQEPYESKLENNKYCEIPEPAKEKELVDANPILIANAIIENKKLEEFNIIISKNSKINGGTLLGTIDNQNIYSPINGVVSDIEKNKITLSNVSESNQTFLESNIKLLTEKYTEISDTRDFLFKWLVPSLLPIMLAESPAVDGEISDDEANGIKFVGINKQWNLIQSNYRNNLNYYEKQIQIVASEDNIKTNAENETLEKINNEIKKEQDLLLKHLKNYNEFAINRSKQTNTLDGEYILIEYYINLLSEISKSTHQTKIEQTFYNQLNKFILQRFYIDEYDREKINKKIILLSNKLSNVDTTNLFIDKLYNKFSNIKFKKDWLKELGKNNKNLTDIEKTSLINQISFLINYYLNINEDTTKYSDLTNKDRQKQISIERNYIYNYFSSLWVNLDNLPNEIKTLEFIINDISVLTTYSVINIDSVNYRYYSIAKNENKCEGADIDPNLGGKTVTKFNDIKYWLKYCSLATLASVANPALGWASGFIGPTGPILFPIVYIPIKAISTDYGFIVFGLTITGAVVMPFVLLVNLSTVFQLPLFDPVVAIKNEINALKLNLTGQLDEFKLFTIKTYLDKTKNELDKATLIYNEAKTNLKNHRSNKPPNIKKYAIEYAKWLKTNIELTQSKLIFGIDKYKIEVKYKSIYIFYTVGGEIEEGGEVNDIIDSLKKTEKIINNQFDKLVKLVEKLEKFIGPLPITLKPDSANFGFTIKNPKPLSVFAINLSTGMIQTNILDNILANFKISNESFMTSKGPIVDYNEYKMKMQASLPLLIPRDPFPAYENLKLSNLGLISFLYTEFVVGGKLSFGIPGLP